VQQQDIRDLNAEKENNKLALQVKKKLGSIPESHEIDRLLKYEGSIEKQFYKAINQLERLQRIRKGDNVPAPVNIDLNIDKENGSG
jgi:CRISPR/Cas system-associated endonuclease Cas1